MELLYLAAGIIIGIPLGMSLQWRRNKAHMRVEGAPPPSAALIYKREPTPDEVAYGKELEEELGDDWDEDTFDMDEHLMRQTGA